MPAAGLGTRLGRSEPKALVPLAGVPMLIRTLEAFRPLGLCRNAIVLHPPAWETRFEEALSANLPESRVVLIPGGRERQDSVRAGLERVPLGTELVILHDAARPFIAAQFVEQAIRAAQIHGGATVAVPAVDTVLEADMDEMLAATPNRTRLWSCQTPQVFRLEPFRNAHARALAEERHFTDDATLFKHYGGRVKIVNGSTENRKITTEDDLRYAEYRLHAISQNAQQSG